MNLAGWPRFAAAALGVALLLSAPLVEFTHDHPEETEPCPVCDIVPGGAVLGPAGPMLSVSVCETWIRPEAGHRVPAVAPAADPGAPRAPPA